MSALASLRLVCPGCASDRGQPFYELSRVPVNSVLLLSSKREALSVPTGDISLTLCRECGFIYNAAFDPMLTEYSSRCEETQAHSTYFREWHSNLARRLIERYDLRGKQVIEIGCGKGEFLSLLCELGGNRGLGFDPAYVADRGIRAAENLEFIGDNYSERYAGHRTDLLCCKMTLEHIPEAFSFLGMLRRNLMEQPETIVFFQVPDAHRILAEKAFWDIYYEHCSYYTLGSLSRLFNNSGFDILHVSRDYGGQYLLIEGRPGGDRRSLPPNADDLTQTEDLASDFASVVSRRVSDWRRCLHEYAKRRVVIWGSGSKGLAFLTSVDAERVIEFVVDINPHRHGHYMAISGQEIVGPEFLREYRPETVIVMNPLYRGEIVVELSRLGLKPEVVTV